MNNINFRNNLDIYNEDWDYLFTQGIERFIKQVFIYTMDTGTKAAGGIITGWDLRASGTQIEIYHNNSTNKGVAFDRNGNPILSSSTYLRNLADTTPGAVNRIAIKYETSTGNFADEVNGRTDPVTDTQYTTQVHDSFEIYIFTDSQWSALTADERKEYVLLGQATAGTMEITTTGVYYISSLIQSGKITADMFVNNLQLLQTQVANSIIYNDNFSGIKTTLEDDLNELRTIIKAIIGEANYNDTPDGSLKNFDLELNFLHNEGTFENYEDELASSLAGAVVTIHTGKTIVNKEVATLITSTSINIDTVNIPRMDIIQVDNLGNISAKEGIVASNPEPPLPDSDKIMVAQTYVDSLGSVQLIDARHLLKRISQQVIVNEFTDTPYPLDKITLHSDIGFIDTSTGYNWYNIEGDNYLDDEIYYTTTGSAYATSMIYTQKHDDLYLITRMYTSTGITVDIDGIETIHNLDYSQAEYQRNFKIGTDLSQGYHKIKIALIDGTLFVDGLVYGAPEIIDLIDGQVSGNRIREILPPDKIADEAVTVEKMTSGPLLAMMAAMRGIAFKSENSIISKSINYNPELAGADVWIHRHDLNVAAYSSASFSLNGFGYTAGGNDGIGNLDVTEQYNDNSDIWVIKTSINTARRNLTGFSLNDFGYAAGGWVAADSAVTEQYNDILNTWTSKTNLNTARQQLTGFSLNGFGYTAGGNDGGNSAATEQYDDTANIWTAATNLNTARSVLSGFSLNGFGYTAGGWIAAASAITEKYNDVENTWTTKDALNTARFGLPGFFLNGFGYIAGGTAGFVDTEQYNDSADLWTVRGLLNISRDNSNAFSLNGFGYAAGGNTGAASAVTERYSNCSMYYLGSFKKSTKDPTRILVATSAKDRHITLPIQIATNEFNWFNMESNRETSTGRVLTDKFLKISGSDFRNYELRVGLPKLNALGEGFWTDMADLNTARTGLSAFSLNGYGYTAGGGPSNITEQYNDSANIWIVKANLNTARSELAGFSLNNFGYTAGGIGPSNVTEQYNDGANTWTVKANLNTPRRQLSAFTLNNFGYTAGGQIAGPADSATTERYNDITGAWTDLGPGGDLNTPRRQLSAFSLNGFGYTAGGWIAAASAVTEQYNDSTVDWAAKANLNTARGYLSAFSLNNFGYTAGGDTATDDETEQYNDSANSWANKADLNTARYSLSAFSLDDFGYTAGGFIGVLSLAATEKYNITIHPLVLGITLLVEEE